MVLRMRIEIEMAKSMLRIVWAQQELKAPKECRGCKEILELRVRPERLVLRVSKETKVIPVLRELRALKDWPGQPALLEPRVRWDHKDFKV
jgi:hypothetical protein